MNQKNKNLTPFQNYYLVLTVSDTHLQTRLLIIKGDFFITFKIYKKNLFNNPLIK